jgi:flagellar hook assembly protein FlgD
MPVQPVWDLELHQASRQLFAFTHGRSAWKLDLNSISLSAPRAQATSGLALSAPMPNPSRGSTRFELTLAARAQVEVNVFDAAGRRIRTVARGKLDAGRFPIVWDARDERGTTIRSGVFFVRASDGVTTRTQRVVLSE